LSEWLKHDGGPNPAPGADVDLIWGIGIIERQPSSKVNWSFKWEWKPSARSHIGASPAEQSARPREAIP
jgi:hypothetical protein